MEGKLGLKLRFWRKLADRRRRYRWEKRLSARLQFYRMFLNPGDLCFDIGANIGKKTDLFLALRARVVAVEPHPGCAEALRKKYADRADVTVVDQGVTMDGREAVFFANQYSSELSSFSTEWMDALKRNDRVRTEWTEPRLQATLTLDRLIESFGQPHFCKIDVEGFEHEVLLGLSRPIPALCFEHLPFYRDPAVRCIERLAQLAEYQFNYAFSEERGLFSKVWLTPEKMIQRVQAHGDRQPAFDIHARLIADQNKIRI